MLFLIDTRERRPERPARGAWEPNWRLWRWVGLALVALAGAFVTTGLVAYLLVCAGLGFACQAIAELVPDTFGLKDYKQ